MEQIKRFIVVDRMGCDCREGREVAEGPQEEIMNKRPEGCAVGHAHHTLGNEAGALEKTWSRAGRTSLEDRVEL